MQHSASVYLSRASTPMRPSQRAQFSISSYFSQHAGCNDLAYIRYRVYFTVRLLPAKIAMDVHELIR